MVGFEVALRDRGPVYVTAAVPYVLARPIRPPAAALLLALFFLFFQSLLDLVLDLVELLGRPTEHPASPRVDGVLDRVGDRSGDANNVTDEVDRVRSQVAELPAQPKPLPPVLCGVVVLPSLRHRDPPPFASPRRAPAVARFLAVAFLAVDFPAVDVLASVARRPLLVVLTREPDAALNSSSRIGTLGLSTYSSSICEPGPAQLSYRCGHTIGEGYTNPNPALSAFFGLRIQSHVR